MFSLRLLGSVTLEEPSGLVTGPAVQHRRLGVLAVLAACGDKGCSRDKLVGLVWPEREEESARHLLATAVYELRSALGEEAVLTTGEYLRLNPDVVRSDVQMFAEALEGVRLDEAVGTYGGPFLEGFYLKEAPEFGRWVESERQRLGDAYTDALEQLADRAEAARDFRRAVEWWRRLIAYDSYNTRVALRLMQAMAESGDRANALQYAQEHERLLRDELGMEPDPELVALAERLRREPAPVSEGVRASTAVPTLIPVDEARVEAVSRRRFLTWRNAGLALVAALAVWGVVATGRMMFGERSVASEAERKSIAVLPFVNRSGLEEDEYFTDGIHDEIITHLSKIPDLKVISRTSVMEYKDRDENLRAIAGQLGVTHVLEGSVRRAGDRVRITTQLIAAEEDEHLWAESYERELIDIFDIQVDVAQRITSALELALTPEELQQIQAKGTQSSEAYDHYLRGKDYLNRREYRLATGMLEKAVTLDSTFAAAYAQLSESYSLLYYQYQVERTEHRIIAAKQAADRALQLAPEQPEPYAALATYYFYCHQDHDRALEWLGEAQKRGATVYAFLGRIQRQRGEWDAALANHERAVEVDPRNPRIVEGVAGTHLWLRHYEEAEREFQKMISIEPDVALGYHWKAWSHLNRGDTETAWQVLLDQRRNTGRPLTWVDSFTGRAALRVLLDDYWPLLQAVSIETARQDTAAYYIAKAISYDLTGEKQAGRAYYDSARAVSEQRVERRPDASLYHRNLGIAYAGLGLREEAIREAKTAVELHEPSDDPVLAPLWVVANLAETYVMVGEFEAALDQLEYLLSIPCPISPPLLRADPLWDSLRDHPRFQALLERYE